MVNTINTTFDCTPKRLNGIDVGNTTNILFSSMLDNFVGIAQLTNMIVAGKLISEDSRIASYILPNHRQKCSGFNIWYNLNNCLPLTLSQPHYSCLTRSSTPTFARTFTTDICLINFDLAIKWINVFAHKFTDLLEHTPSRLIGYSKRSLQLLGRYTCFGRRHQKYGMEPRAKWSI